MTTTTTTVVEATTTTTTTTTNIQLMTKMLTTSLEVAVARVRVAVFVLFSTEVLRSRLDVAQPFPPPCVYSHFHASYSRIPQLVAICCLLFPPLCPTLLFPSPSPNLVWESWECCTRSPISKQTSGTFIKLIIIIIIIIIIVVVVITTTTTQRLIGGGSHCKVVIGAILSRHFPLSFPLSNPFPFLPSWDCQW